MRKRIFCIMLACLLGLTTTAWAREESVPEQDTFRMAGFDNTQYRTWESNVFFTRMEEKTGVHFTYQQYTESTKWTAAKAAMEADGDLPDILFKANLSSSECIALREKGVLIDLKPYLESCCPNLWAILQEHPDYLAAITLPDGSIAALPFIQSAPTQNYMWINTKWLKNLGLAEPTTADELRQVLEAFRDKDPNRNGKQDEIPFGFLGPFDLKFLGHAFGLVANDYNIYVKDGQVRFMPLDENYRLFVTWCRDLYAAGLLDQNGFSTNSLARQVTDNNQAAVYGVILAPTAAAIFQTNWATDYTILPPLAYDGTQVYREFVGHVLRGTFAVTSACRAPEKMLQWVDTLYGEEGAILATVGRENEDYLVDGDGTWRLTESARSNAYFTVTHLIEGGGSWPGIQADEFQKRYGDSDLSQDTLDRHAAVNALCVQPFPYYTLTQAQADAIDDLQLQIGYMVDMRLAQWVLGEAEITDASFQQFENDLYDAGLTDFLAFWQEIYDHL